MALKVKCDRCGEELKEPGGLVFSPPEAGVSLKFHVCDKCWPSVALIVQGIADTGLVTTSNTPILYPSQLKHVR